MYPKVFEWIDGQPAPAARPSAANAGARPGRRGSIAAGAAAPVRFVPSFDREGPMDRRTPLQHLLRNFLPTRGRAATPTPTPEFMDTRPDGPNAASVRASRQVTAPARQPGGWSESAIDLVLGTEVMEYPDDTAADLMDEFFAGSKKRAS
jgi:hypothetical protein